MLGNSHLLLLNIEVRVISVEETISQKCIALTLNRFDEGVAVPVTFIYIWLGRVSWPSLAFLEVGLFGYGVWLVTDVEGEFGEETVVADPAPEQLEILVIEF